MGYFDDVTNVKDIQVGDTVEAVVKGEVTTVYETTVRIKPADKGTVVVWRDSVTRVEKPKPAEPPVGSVIQSVSTRDKYLRLNDGWHWLNPLGKVDTYACPWSWFYASNYKLLVPDTKTIG